MSRSILRDQDQITCGDTAAAPDRGFTVDGRPVVLVGDLSAGHDGFPPTPVVDGAAGFTLNGVPVALDGSLYVDHSDGDSVHTQRSGIGSSSFTVS